MTAHVLQAVFNKKNLLILLPGILSTVAIFIVLIYLLRDHLDAHPCEVCGKPAYHKVETYYAFQHTRIPKANIEFQWFCDDHLDQSTHLSASRTFFADSIQQRIKVNIILSIFGIVALYLALTILDLPVFIIFLHPAVMVILILIWGVSHALTSTLIFLSLFGLPLLVWLKWLYSQRSRYG